jgi:hypothetical protein
LHNTLFRTAIYCRLSFDWLPFSFLSTNGVGSWAKAEFKVSAPKIIKIDIAAYLSMRNILDAGLTTVLYQRDRDYCIGMVSSRWAANGADVCGAGGL